MSIQVNKLNCDACGAAMDFEAAPDETAGPIITEVPPLDYEAIKLELEAKNAEFQVQLDSLAKAQEQIKKLMQELAEVKDKLEQKEDDFRALTRSQFDVVGQQSIKNKLVLMVQDIGKHTKKCEIEIRRFPINENIHDDVMAAVHVLRATADEFEKLVNTYDCGVIDV
jgi:cell division septum initiation protein DivIVA